MSIWRARITSVMPTAATSTGAVPTSRSRRFAGRKKAGATTRPAAEQSERRRQRERAHGQLPPVRHAAPSAAWPRARARMRLLRGRRAVERAGDRAAAHDRDAVAHAEDLGQLGRDHEDGQALRGELHNEPVDLGLGARRPRPGSARRGSSTAGRVASQRASATFCWLPPESVRDGRVERRRLDREALRRRSSRSRAPSGESRKPPRVRAPQARRAWCWRRRHLEDHAVPPAVLGHVGDAEARPPPPGQRRAPRVPRRRMLALVGRGEAEEHARQLRPPGARRGRRGPRSRPPAPGGSRSRTPPPGSRGPATSSTTSPRVDRALGEDGVELAADHQADQLAPGRRSAIGRVATSCAVAQHGDAVGEAQHLLQAVRDVDDRRRPWRAARGSASNSRSRLPAR